MIRSTVTAATAFVVLAWAAGSGIAASGAPGTLQDADNAIQLTVEQCEGAWAASEAYGECGDRLQVEGSGQPETVEPVGNLCVIKTSCLHYASTGNSGNAGIGKLTRTRRDTSWNGGLENTRSLKNCNGSLWLSC